MMRLEKHNYSSCVVVTTLVLASLFSCKKGSLSPSDSGPGGQISFINSSAQLLADIGSGSNAYILKDLMDTFYEPAVYPASFKAEMPYFNKEHNYQYPSTTYNAGLPAPWITYLQTDPVSHVFSLVDTSHYLRSRDTINLQPDQPVSVYYSDSLGYFRSFILHDQPGSDAGRVRLRFLDFSPDAGQVFFTINERPAAASGFVPSLLYGQTSSFVSYPNPATDTLRINFYQSTDSSTVLARLFLKADPGRAYTIALQGYYNYYIGYPDPRNMSNYRSLQGGLSVRVNINN